MMVREMAAVITAAMVMVTAAVVMPTTTLMAMMARRGVGNVAVAFLPSCLKFGRAFGANPPVGIGPWQMPPSRACGLFRLRGPQPHIPPTPSVGVGGGGLMKGTPRNSSSSVIGAMVRWCMVIVYLHRALLLHPSPFQVVLVGVCHTRVVVRLIVTTTSGVRRQVRRSRSQTGHGRVPSHAHDSVRVAVTIPMTDVMTTIDGDVGTAG